MSEANPLDEFIDMAGREPDIERMMNLSLSLLGDPVRYSS